MDFKMIPLMEENMMQFKEDMQAAFQFGAEAAFGPIDREILPEKDIVRSLTAKGATAYKAVVDGEMAGGAVVVIDGTKGELAFLYVKKELQGKKIGQQLWQAMETHYPAVTVWETCTPYFEKRNIHFYINCCGFAAVEFYHPGHPEADMPLSEEHDEEEAYFFRFEKVVSSR